MYEYPIYYKHSLLVICFLYGDQGATTAVYRRVCEVSTLISFLTMCGETPPNIRQQLLAATANWEALKKLRKSMKNKWWVFERSDFHSLQCRASLGKTHNWYLADFPMGYFQASSSLDYTLFLNLRGSLGAQQFAKMKDSDSFVHISFVNLVADSYAECIRRYWHR